MRPEGVTAPGKSPRSASFAASVFGFDDLVKAVAKEVQALRPQKATQATPKDYSALHVLFLLPLPLPPPLLLLLLLCLQCNLVVGTKDYTAPRNEQRAVSK